MYGNICYALLGKYYVFECFETLGAPNLIYLTMIKVHSLPAGEVGIFKYIPKTTAGVLILAKIFFFATNF